MPLANLRNLLLDVDGVVLHDQTAIPGAAEAVARLRDQDYGVAFLTNDNGNGPQRTADKLTRAGIPTEPAAVVTGSTIVARFARRWRGKGLRILLLGTAELRRMLAAEGVETITPSEYAEGSGVDIVLMGRDDTQFTHASVSLLARALREERPGRPPTRFYAANPDARQPGQGGYPFMAGTGAMVAAVAYVADRRPTFLAKPAARAIKLACDILGWQQGEMAMVGDSLSSDIAMARRASVFSILVLSGDTRQADLARLPATLAPDQVLPDLAAVPEWLARVGARQLARV